MTIYKPNEPEILDSLNIYYETGEINNFIEKGGLWIIRFACTKFQLSEDDQSEVFLEFYTRAENFAKLYQIKKETNVTGLLYIFSRNIIYNYLRKKRNRQKQEELIIWDRSNTLSGYKLLEKVKLILSQLNQHARLVIFLRHNIEMYELDQAMLKSLLKRKDIELSQFLRKHAERVENNRSKIENLTHKLSYYTRLQYLSNKQIEQVKDKKMRVQNKLYRKRGLYSFDEISYILDISKTQVVKIYNLAIEQIRSEFTTKKAA